MHLEFGIWNLGFHFFFCHIAAKSRLASLPGKNQRLTPSHWQLSQLGFKPRQWWETASSQWQHLRPHSYRGRHSGISKMKRRETLLMYSQRLSNYPNKAAVIGKMIPLWCYDEKLATGDNFLNIKSLWSKWGLVSFIMEWRGKCGSENKILLAMTDVRLFWWFSNT